MFTKLGAIAKRNLTLNYVKKKKDLHYRI